MNKSTRRRGTRGSLALVLLLFASSVPALAATEPAVWRSQELRFDYRGALTMYECQMLEQKVRSILAAVGAQQRTNVEQLSCQIVNLPNASTQLAAMRISVVSPAPAGSAGKELAADAGRRELLRHLGLPSVPAGEFAAEWRSIDVTDLRQLDVSSADCELLRQLREQVLDRLAVHVIDGDRSCSASPQRLRQPRLKVLALWPSGADDYSSRLAAP